MREKTRLEREDQISENNQTKEHTRQKRRPNKRADQARERTGQKREPDKRKDQRRERRIA